MTVLSIPIQLAVASLADNKALATCPTIISTADTFVSGSANGVQGTYTYFQNLFASLSHTKGVDIEADKMVFGIYAAQSATKLALSKNKKFCYLHGQQSGIGQDFAHKINIAENTIIWGTINPLDDGELLVNTPTACAINNAGNVLISSSTGLGLDAQTHILDSQSGAVLYTSTLRGGSRFQVRSDNTIYLTLGRENGTPLYNVYKLNSNLTINTQAYPQATTLKVMTDCVLSHDETVLFVCGDNSHLPADPTPAKDSLWALDPDDLSILGSSNILGRQLVTIPRMKLMADGSLVIVTFDSLTTNSIARRITYSSGTFTEVTTGNWPIDSTTADWTEPFLGPFNYMMITLEDGGPPATSAIRVYTKDGTFVRESHVIQGPKDIVFPATKKARHMNQTTEPENEPTIPADSTDFTEIEYLDMCCMLSDTIVKYDPASTYAIDDLFYHEGIGLFEDSLIQLTYYNNVQTQGVFKVIEAVPSPVGFVDDFDKFERISKTIPCQNPNWDQYTGFGGQAGGGLIVDGVQTGIANSPQLYTISFNGLLIADDGGVSSYNINAILKRIPGMWGAFSAYDPVTNLQINFNINSVLIPSFAGAGDDIYPINHSEKIRAYIRPNIQPTHAILSLEENGINDDAVRINGNRVAEFPTGSTIEIVGAADPVNDGQYTVISANGSIITTVVIAAGSLNSDGGAVGTAHAIQQNGLIFEADIVNSNWDDPAVPGSPVDAVDYGADPQIPFEYRHDASPTAIDNVLIDASPNIAYDGICSLYPGRREEWDAITTFVIAIIVAHDGYFWQADSENTNTEPSTAGGNPWTQLSGPV